LNPLKARLSCSGVFREESLRAVQFFIPVLKGQKVGMNLGFLRTLLRRKATDERVAEAFRNEIAKRS
jgi:hypothetical protein